MAPKGLWSDMTAEDLRRGDVGRWIAVLPVAAIEQHGPHLPLGVDAMIAEGYIARVLRLLPDDLPATFLPVQQIGKSDEHLSFPGTLTLSAETALHAWGEIGASLARAGIRKLVIVNSHGGNSALIDMVALDLRIKFGMAVVTTGWHRFGYPPDLFGAGELRHGIHGGMVETSLMLAFRPELVRMELAEDFVPASLAIEAENQWLRTGRPAALAWMVQDLHPSGALGNALAASATAGDLAAEHGARSFIELLQELDRFDPARLGA